MIKNDDAREKYIMVHLASGRLSQKKVYYSIDKLSQMYPNENVIKITRAGMYGDLGQSLSAEKEIEHKAQAVQWLKPFVEKEYQDPYSHDRILALSQYYYHSGQFKKQFEFGQEVLANGKHGGEVLVAVGGSMYALKLDQQGQLGESKKVAQEAQKNWGKIYDFSDPRLAKAAYQNSYYVSSLALLGSCEEAQQIFNQNIKTSKRYNEMARWLTQFSPKNLKSCQTLQKLTQK